MASTLELELSFTESKMVCILGGAMMCMVYGVTRNQLVLIMLDGSERCRGW